MACPCSDILCSNCLILGSLFSTVILLLEGPVAVLTHPPGQASLSASVTLGERPRLRTRDVGWRTIEQLDCVGLNFGSTS